jgi:CheY-like chemotaxis protein
MLEQATPTRPLRVLAADSDPEAANRLAALVGLWGHEAQPAYDLDDVLGASAWFWPDVIVIEAAMVIGAASITRAKRTRPGPCPLLIGFTADDPAELAEQFPGVFDRYLRKPDFQEALQAILAAARKLPDA